MATNHLLKVYYNSLEYEIETTTLTNPTRRQATLSLRLGISESDLSTLILLPIFESSDTQDLVFGSIELLDGDPSYISSFTGIILLQDPRLHKLTSQDYDSIIEAPKAALVRTSSLSVILNNLLLLKLSFPNEIVLYDLLERETYDFEYTILYSKGMAVQVLNINENLEDNLMKYFGDSYGSPRDVFSTPDDIKFELDSVDKFISVLRTKLAAIAREFALIESSIIAYRIFNIYPYNAKLLMIAAGSDGNSNAEYVEYISSNLIETT